MGRLAGKVAVVTGANSGIGQAAAVAMAREGARVALVARRVAEGEDATSEVRAAGNGDAFFHRADVTDPDAIAGVVAAVTERWGPAVHCLFNNVGGALRPSGQPTEQLEDFEATLRLTLTSAWMMTEACWTALRAAGSASVVNNSSAAAVSAFSARHMEMLPAIPPSSYFAAKAAVEGLTRYHATMGAAHGIRVNAVRPGQIETPMAKMGGDRHFAHEMMTANQVLARSGLAEDVASAVVYLSSDESSFVTATVLDVDGGLLCRP